MRRPLARTLERAWPGKGKRLRELLTSAAAVREHPAAQARVRECYHPPKLADLRMTALNAELDMFGVEFTQSSGRKQSFTYLNAGDPYAVTIVRFEGPKGDYRVTDWGTIVEKGGYK